MIRIGKGCISLFFSLFVFLFVSTSWAQVNVSATVDRNQVVEGDSFILTISVSSTSSRNINEPKLPNLIQFDLLNSWNSSQTSSTFSNGQFQVERVKSFNYMLAPKKKGYLTIGSAQVLVDGRTYPTKSIKMQVLAGGASPPKNRRQARRPKRPRLDDSFDSMDDIFSQLLNRRGQPGFRSQIKNPKESFFIQVEVDKTKVYVGEQVTVSWYLYTKGNITEIDTLKYPSLNGFWKEDIEVATRLNFQQEVVNGVAYKKALLASYALFPIKKGRAIVDSYKAKCRVVVGGFGFGRSYQFTKASEEVKIEVLQIPLANRPKDFSGAVGQFDVSAMVQKSKNNDLVFNANEPLTYKIRFEGKGNAKRIDLPGFDWPDEIEFYDTKKESKFFKNGESYKEFELLLIPRKPGEMLLPEFSVSLFDPETEQYYQKKVQAQSIQVNPGQGGEAPSSSPLVQGTSEKQNKEPMIPPLFTEWIEVHSKSSVRKAYVWGGLFSIGFLFILWRASIELNWRNRKRNLVEEVEQRIQRAKASKDRGEWREVGVELTNAMYLALGSASTLGSANVQLEKLIKKLPPSLRREYGDRIVKFHQKLEMISFAPEKVVGLLKEKNELELAIKEGESLLKKVLQG